MLPGDGADHLNAEIASGGGYMGDVGVCIRWLKSTFLWARLAKNPAHYEMPKGMSDDELERRLKALCIAQLRQLADAQMVLVDDDGLSIAPVTHTARTHTRTHAHAHTHTRTPTRTRHASARARATRM